MPVILLHVLLVVSIVGLLSTSYYPCCGTTLHRKFFSDGPALHFDRYVRKWRTAWKGRRSAGTLFQTADTSVATVHTAYAHCWHYHVFFCIGLHAHVSFSILLSQKPHGLIGRVHWWQGPIPFLESEACACRSKKCARIWAKHEKIPIAVLEQKNP